MEMDTCYEAALPSHSLPGQLVVRHLATCHWASALHTENRTFKSAQVCNSVGVG